MAGGSYTGKFLRARALGKASQMWSSASESLSPKLETAQGVMSRAYADVKERKNWNTPEGVITTKGPNTARSKQASIDSAVTSSAGAESTSSKGWGSTLSGVTGYFSAGARERRDQTFYTEEKVVCFPGWATLRPAAHASTEPALVLEILTHGYAYRLRPIAQASRSQRMFVYLAKSIASLPKIPAHLMPKGQLEDAGQSVDSLSSSLKDFDMSSGSVYEKLVDIGGREGAREEVEAIESTLAEEPEEMEEGESKPATPEPPILDTPANLARRPRIATANSTSSAPQISTSASPTASTSRPTRNATMFATSSASSSRPSSLHGDSPSKPSRSATASTTASTATSSSAQSKPEIISEWPRPFSYKEEDLPRLHSNLAARLEAFFGQKLAMRKIRLTVYPDLPAGSLVDKPLVTKVVTTGSSGGFRTTVEVRSKALRKLLDETGQGVESLDGMRLRVVAELLEVDSVTDALSGGIFNGHHQGLKVTADDDALVQVGKDGGVRVISDIDDTIKWTEVTHGTKSIFRNVFVRELTEIQVPGMSDWYRKMEELTCQFHYVSNSPWELWNVLRKFLHIANFPAGSATLKEYGSASGAVAKLWEEPGQRKRANVENIIKEFPHCKFLLVGDSGEQDMNLYVALAAQYPDTIVGIWIRDVSTPFTPSASPDLTLPTHTKAPSTDQRPFSEMPDLPGQFDGSHETPLPSRPPLPPRKFSRLRRGGTTDSYSPSNSQPPSRSSSPPLLDENSDALSPNNPLRPEPGLGTTVEKEKAAAAKAALIEAFYARVRECEKVLPKHIPLRIFRHGKECEEEALRIVGENLPRVWS
ncbi:hypothetical protein MNV49_003645 [Pseudohyphozyma bogoriensis]|nr:hypothetical protein MNV49_003645 [Pseudohyphozyma bogoriensis]